MHKNYTGKQTLSNEKLTDSFNIGNAYENIVSKITYHLRKIQNNGINRLHTT